MSTEQIELLQKLLLRRGFLLVKPDGIVGTNTLNAVYALKGIKTTFTQEQKLIAAFQIIASENQIPIGGINGLWNTQTEQAVFALSQMQARDKNPANLWAYETAGKPMNNEVWIPAGKKDWDNTLSFDQQ